MDVFVSIDPGKTCGACFASMSDGKFKLHAVAAIECRVMSSPTEVVHWIQERLDEMRARPSVKNPGKRTKVELSSITVGLETQFSHPGSIRNEAWLSGALWSWAQNAYTDTPFTIRAISGQSRLKTPTFVGLEGPKLVHSTGASKAQRRKAVKAHARRIVDCIFASTPVLLDLTDVVHWHSSLGVGQMSGASRSHDAVDAVLLMMVLANEASDPSKRSIVRARPCILPRLSLASFTRTLEQDGREV